MGKLESGMIEVWNKIDLLGPEELDEAFNQAATGVIPVSAADGAGIDALLHVIDAVVNLQFDRKRLRLSFPEVRMPEAMAYLHKKGAVDADSMVVAEDGSG